MQAPLPPAHPVPGFADRRLRSTNDGKGRFLYGGCHPFSPSPRASPLATPFTPSPCASPRSSPSPRSPTSSSGSLLIDDADAVATEHCAVLQYKSTPDNHYERCVAHLADAAREADALRLENQDLRVANSDLASRFAMLAKDQATSGLFLPQIQMPTTPAEKHPLMPKSISIRRSVGRGGGGGHGHGHGKIPVPKIGQGVSADQDDAKAEEHQIGAGEKCGQVLKATGGLQIYNQGTLKTELCDNWEKAGFCPYGDRCRFAHGIAELRPIIRHARYKTQICRMFASGRCSYGHRCHFRHSIGPSDHP